MACCLLCIKFGRDERGRQLHFLECTISVRTRFCQKWNNRIMQSTYIFSLWTQVKGYFDVSLVGFLFFGTIPKIEFEDEGVNRFDLSRYTI